MTKQMKLAMAAVLVAGCSPAIHAQEPLTTTTKTVKVKPGETKTTVITKENGTAPLHTTVTTTAGAKKKHTTAHKTAARKEPVESATTRELRELREKQVTQQAQIDALLAANAAKDAQLTQAQTAATQAEADAQNAASQTQTVTANVQANTDAVQALKSNVNDLQTVNTGLASTISANKVELTDKIDSPTVLHYKGVTITPVAFLAFEGVFRQRSLNSDINTPFNTTPFPGSGEAHTTELNFTARQTRLGGLFEAKPGTTKLSGYFETDFLSAASTSNSNQSNSYSLRVRQAWGKAETRTGFAVTGGQTWSLVTEDGKGTDVRTEKLPNTVDSQYLVGYSWARQPGIRLQQKLGNPFLGSAVTIAVSAEQAQIQSFSATNAPANFFFGGAGVGGGLFAPTSNYTNNFAPDVISKIAFDFPHTHFEIGGLARFFRDRLYPGIAVPNTTPGSVANAALTPYNSVTFGGGGFANIRTTISKYLDIGAEGMVGDGTGRYGSAQLADVTVRPNGTLEPIRNAHGLGKLEGHAGKKLDIYAYYGGEYAQRTQYKTGVAATPYTGYGTINTVDTGCETESTNSAGNSGFTGTDTAANCAAVTKYIQQGMVGFTYKPINDPKYGRLQYQITYSYLTKSAWEGLTAGTFGNVATQQFGSPKAVNNMVHFSMRYYIP